MYYWYLLTNMFIITQQPYNSEDRLINTKNKEQHCM